MKRKRLILRNMGLATACASAAAPARQADWFGKPVDLGTPFEAGGGRGIIAATSSFTGGQNLTLAIVNEETGTQVRPTMSNQHLGKGNL